MSAGPEDWRPPGSLADVLPGAARALGVATVGGSLELPPSRLVVVLLVDGLGADLLAARAGHAPFLRSLRGAASSTTLASGFPSTTATSMGMLGTGLPPGAHGLVGLDVLDPARDVLFNELLWDPAVDPRHWQPLETVFERVAAAGHDVIRIGPGYFDGSGLTEAVQRGGRFVAAQTFEARVDAAVRAARSASSGLVYVYWGDLDKTGHERGCGSWQWLEELERVDSFVQRLAERLPGDATLLVTADHGMIDVPDRRRVDVVDEPDLISGVRHVGGEPRSVQLYCEPGAVDDVVDTWRARFGADLDVLTRSEAVRAGWFGPVSERVLPRIGDVVTASVDDLAVFDSRTARPEVLALKGFHGARTRVETLIPLLVTPGLAS